MLYLFKLKMKKTLFIFVVVSILILSYAKPNTADASFFNWIKRIPWFSWIKDRKAPSPEENQLNQYYLLVSKTGIGTVISDDGKVRCSSGKNCEKYNYTTGSPVTLTATPSDNYIFKKWDGCDETLAEKCKVIISHSKKIIARFELKKYASSEPDTNNNTSYKTKETVITSDKQDAYQDQKTPETYTGNTDTTSYTTKNNVELMPMVSEQISQTEVVSNSPNQINTIDSCKEITKSGSYHLSSNLSSINGNGTCLYIHDTTDVHINCNGHSILGEVYKSKSKFEEKNNGDYAVLFRNVNNFSLSTCKLNTNSHVTLKIENSQVGEIDNNQFGKLYVKSEDSSDLIFKNNNFSWYEQTYSNDVTINNNIFDVEIDRDRGTTVVESAIVSSRGSGNKFINNKINGNAEGIFEKQEYADDGIVVEDESNDLIQNNEIKNVWDCGIETLGNISNIKIIKNNISNAGICGIGGWYHNSLIDSSITENFAQNTPLLFYFYREYGLRPANWDSKGILGDNFIYFKNNYFTGNRLTNPRVSPGKYSSDFIIRMPNSLSIPGERYPNDSELIIENNYFKNNDFGTELNAPHFYPLSIATDNGGNKCGSTESKEGGPITNYPLSCN